MSIEFSTLRERLLGGNHQNDENCNSLLETIIENHIGDIIQSFDTTFLSVFTSAFSGKNYDDDFKKFFYNTFANAAVTYNRNLLENNLFSNLAEKVFLRYKTVTKT